MSGTIIVTGAAGGVGFAISETLLRRPETFTCILTVRDKNAANAGPVEDLIKSSAGSKQAEVAEIDLSNFESIRAFADNIKSRVSAGELPPIRALILNAAYIPVGPERKYAKASVDGKELEMNFAVNFLANVKLSFLLLKSLDKDRGRIVYVSSMASDPQSWFSPGSLPWDLEDFAFPKQPPLLGDGTKDARRRYGTAKLCQIMFMNRLQKRLESTAGLEKVCIIGVDPGAMVHAQLISKQGRGSPFATYVAGPALMGYSRLARYMWPNGAFRTVSKSAADVVRAAVGLDDLDGYPKGIYMNGSERGEPAAESKDEERQKEVWDFGLGLAKVSEKEAGLSYGDERVNS